MESPSIDRFVLTTRNSPKLAISSLVHKLGTRQFQQYTGAALRSFASAPRQFTSVTGGHNLLPRPTRIITTGTSPMNDVCVTRVVWTERIRELFHPLYVTVVKRRIATTETLLGEQLTRANPEITTRNTHLSSVSGRLPTPRLF